MLPCVPKIRGVVTTGGTAHRLSPRKGNAPVLRVIRAGSTCLSVPPDLRVAEHARGRASCASAFARRMGAHVERRHRRPASLCVGRRPQHSEQFLIYRVFDALTDSFFPLLARIDEQIDELEAYRDLLSGATDLYLSTVSNRQNEVMKQLAIVGTILLPLSFITGFFGQNFRWLVATGISSTWSFFVLGIGSIVATCVFLLGFFKRKGWM